MTYYYVCPICKNHTEVIKSMKESDRIEHCPVCQYVLKRVYESPSVITADGYKK